MPNYDNQSNDKPFNDAMEHQQNIEGSPIPKETGKLPFPIKLIGFFLLFSVILIIVFAIIGGVIMN